MLEQLKDKNIFNVEDVCNEIIKNNIILRITLKYYIEII
jgi:hypothetical protein